MTIRRRITIRHVAAAAGVSVPTVSRAIRSPELLSRATLDKVNAAIAALDYTPNLAAQHLRGSRTDLVLVVVPSLSPFFLEICRGVEEAAMRSGQGVLVGHTDRRAARERHFIDETAAGRADGLILVTSVDLPAIAATNRLPPIVVALDVSERALLPTVRVDHAAGAEEATRFLIEQGHRRIAHITGPPLSGMTQHRLEGYRAALHAHGIAAAPDHVVAGDFTLESGEAAMARLLAAGARPTAVFAANDQMAMGAVRIALAAGLRVPQDMSVFGFDDERLAGLFDPSLSTVRVPTFEIGQTAMMQLARLLDGEEIEREIVLDTELAIRHSAGPVPADG